MGTALTIIHIVTCFFLIVVVLLQSGKAADLAGAFGGMGSQTAFGPRGAATILTKATTIGFVLFVLTSVTLGIYGSSVGGSTTGESVVEQTGLVDTAEEGETATPATPVAPSGPVPGQNLGEFTINPDDVEDGVLEVDVGDAIREQEAAGEPAPDGGGN